MLNVNSDAASQKYMCIKFDHSQPLRGIREVLLSEGTLSNCVGMSDNVGRRRVAQHSGWAAQEGGVVV